MVQIQGVLQQRYGVPAIPTRRTANLYLFLPKPWEVLQLRQYPRIDAGGSSSNGHLTVWILGTSTVGSMCLLFHGQLTQPAAAEVVGSAEKIGAFPSKLRWQHFAAGVKLQKNCKV